MILEKRADLRGDLFASGQSVLDTVIKIGEAH